MSNRKASTKQSTIHTSNTTSFQSSNYDTNTNDPTDTTAFVEPESVIASQSSIEWVWVVILIILSVMLLCTATTAIVCYRKWKRTEDKTIQNLKAPQVPSKNDGNVNQISKEDMSSKKVELSS
eukprot:515795_1